MRSFFVPILLFLLLKDNPIWKLHSEDNTVRTHPHCVVVCWSMMTSAKLKSGKLITLVVWCLDPWPAVVLMRSLVFTDHPWTSPSGLRGEFGKQDRLFLFVERGRATSGEFFCWNTLYFSIIIIIALTSKHWQRIPLIKYSVVTSWLDDCQSVAPCGIRVTPDSRLKYVDISWDCY